MDGHHEHNGPTQDVPEVDFTHLRVRMSGAEPRRQRRTLPRITGAAQRGRAERRGAGSKRRGEAAGRRGAAAARQQLADPEKESEDKRPLRSSGGSAGAGESGRPPRPGGDACGMPRADAAGLEGRAQRSRNWSSERHRVLSPPYPRRP